MKTYKALLKRFPDQNPDEVFAHFGWDGEAGENWESPFERLSQLAPEQWDFNSPHFKRRNQRFPILTNYLNYTFLRVQELGLIAYSGDGNRGCFNTGLQTPQGKDIFVTFYRNRDASRRNQPDWTWFTFAESYSNKLDSFRPLPEIATYVTDASDLVFDTSYEIDINFEHIVDKNADRLPEVLRSNPALAIVAIRGAVERLKDRVLRNYKIAIPHWYEGRVQLLLPLNLTSDDKADLALVADRDKSTRLYRIRTILSMDMAYIDARLITRPDREWLNP